jgi:hypothetical protein
VDVCWFGDLKWWQWHKNDLKRFSGIVAHCNDKSSITIKMDRGVSKRKAKWVDIKKKGQ